MKFQKNQNKCKDVVLESENKEDDEGEGDTESDSENQDPSFYEEEETKDGNASISLSNKFDSNSKGINDKPEGSTDQHFSIIYGDEY